eukprot:1194061-Prorocentrum_minimum.AAC.1
MNPSKLRHACSKSLVVLMLATTIWCRSADNTVDWQKHGYARYNPNDLSEATFDAAYKENRTADLEIVVMVSSFSWPPVEDLAWLNEQPWPVFVSTKEPGKGYHSEPWGNVGWDIASYLRFIVDFWDILPKRVAFVHGHNMAWHQAGYKMSYILRNICWSGVKYVNLNTNPQDPVVWKQTAQTRSGIVQLVEKTVGKIWNRPATNTDRCCQQYLVSREAIKTRPLTFWKEMLALMTDGDRLKANRLKGVFDKRPTMALDLPFLEESWHYIFGVEKINQHKLYGYHMDVNIETGEKMTSHPRETLQKFVKCPAPLCQLSPTCKDVVDSEKARSATAKGKLADGADS